MKTLLSLAVVLRLLALTAGAAEDLPRVAVLPLTPEGDQLPSKHYGEEIADYVEGRLHEFPGVVWVERAELDKLLGEVELNAVAGSDASAVSVGRLLKADLVIHGRFSEPHWDKTEKGENVVRRHVVIEVTDLTNASVLASVDMPLNPIEGQTSEVYPAFLDQCAEAARNLLTASLKARRAAAAGIALAPLFFSNAGASPRLDSWGDILVNRFAELSGSFPGANILRFRGVGEAAGEQSLSLLGLTDADPNVWQTAANGYIWGSYHEIAPDKTTAFDDIQVEAELFLMMGGKEPKRFTRRFAVKDFDSQSRALVTDILREAVANKNIVPSPDAGKRMASAIFNHLCDWIGAGFFTRKPDIAGHAAMVVQPVRSLRFGDAKFEYCLRMLEIACFFDPENARLQLLRDLVRENTWEIQGTPDDQLITPADCVNKLKILVRDPGYDPDIFANAVESVMNLVIARPNFLPWHSDFEILIPPQLPAERERLLAEFYPLLIEQTPIMIRKLDQAGASDQARSDAAGWLKYLLNSQANNEIKFQFFQTVWPLLGDKYWGQLDGLIEPLMSELGDRARVRDVMMKAAAAVPSPTAAPAQAAASRPANVVPPSQAASSFPEPLLEGLTPIEAPTPHDVSLPWDRMALISSDPRLPPRLRQPFTGRPFGIGGSISSIELFGDKLILHFNSGRGAGGAPFASSGCCIYRISTGQIELIDPPRPAFLCLAPGGRLLYRNGETVGSIDLLSDTGTEFSASEGLPVEAASMIGFGGARYAAVAGENKRVVGLFDWSLGKWLTPPSPPAPAPASPAAEAPNPGYPPFKEPIPSIAGTDETIIFPQWNLRYDTTAQVWKDLPAPPLPKDPQPIRPFTLPPAPGSLVLNGEVWRWNANGILDFSLQKNQVVWQAAASHLSTVAQDGPYLWVSFQTFSTTGAFPYPHPEGRLLLLDRVTHRPLGVFALPRPGLGLSIGEHDFWLSGAQLRHWEKADLYAALGVPVPPPAKAISPPFRPGETGSPISLYDAILRGDLQTVKTLLTNPGAADTLIGHSQTPAITVAVWSRNTAIVKLFLRHHPNLDATPTIDIPPEDPYPPRPPTRQSTDATPLVAAARQPDPEMTHLLLDAGAKPTNTALMEALDYRHADVAETLLKAGAPATGATDLILRQKDSAMAARVLALNLPIAPAERTSLQELARPEDATLDPHVAADLGQVCGFIQAALKDKNEARAIALMRYVPPTSASDGNVRALLFAAIQFGSANIVDTLLRDGVSPNPTDAELAPGGAAPLGVSLGQPQAALLLLRHGANPRLLDHQKALLMEVAAGSPSGPEVLPELLKNYPSLDTRLGYGTLGGTALCAAVGRCFIGSSYRIFVGADIRQRTIKLLLDMGVSPSAHSREGDTALHVAFALHDPATACMLAGSGADLHEPDLAGRTVLDGPYLSTGNPDGFKGPIWTNQSGFKEFLDAYQPTSDVESLGKTRLLEAIDARPTLADLREAVIAGDLARVNALLNRRAVLDPPYDQALLGEAFKPGLVFLAVTHHARDLAETLMLHGCDPNVGELGVNNWNFSPTPYNGNPQMLQGGPRHPARGGCNTPLIAAAEAGDLEMVKMLLKHGAYAPVMDQFHRNAIDAAATPQIAQFIRDNTRVQFAAQQLFDSIAAGPAAFAPIAGIAQTCPEAFSVRNSGGLTPLNFPLRLSAGMMEQAPFNIVDTDALAFIHKCGIKLTGLDDFGMTPLHEAVLYASLKDIPAFLKVGFDPSTPDSRGITSLDLAQGILDDSLKAKIIALLDDGASISPH